MTKPDEAALIELEQVVLAGFQKLADENAAFTKYDRVVQTLEYLIARARFHNDREKRRTS
jgi:hypothetical protein